MNFSLIEHENQREPDIFSGGPKEYCGVMAAIGGRTAVKTDVTDIIFHAMRTLQHRGQESAGMATYNGGLQIRRRVGLVHEALGPQDLEELAADRGIGHVRYSTMGGQDSDCHQPMNIHTSFGELAIAHNGEIVNAHDLRRNMMERGGSFKTHSDSEVILKLLAEKITASGDLIDGIREMMKTLVGSYSMVLMVNEKVLAMRDPLAIRPLCIGTVGQTFCATSESVVFDSLGGKMARDMRPGEIIELNDTGFISHKGITAPKPAHCMFEWIYFARPDSVIDNRLVYGARRRVGIQLAEEAPVHADFVIPVPDSGRAHAIGYCEASGIPYAEGLIKNRYIQRTFIMPGQGDRERAVNLKLNALRPVIEGKRVILIDDSIVRGTTMKKIVQLVKSVGPKEVHLRIGCPPIRAPCYFGIDMKDRDEFIATKSTIEGIRKFLDVDSLAYASIDNIVSAIKKERGELCLGCLTGEYPVKIPGEKLRK